MTDVVAGLERSGLVQRVAHPTDRRSTMVTPTAEGVDLIRRRRWAQIAYINDNLSHLPPEQLDVLAHALGILSAGFGITLHADVPSTSGDGAPEEGAVTVGRVARGE
jgi:hypothetical protein